MTFGIQHNRSVRIRGDFGNHVDDIHPEPRYTAVKPELHNIPYGFSHLRVLPIQVGLFWGKDRQVVLPSLGVVSPCRVGLAQDLSPIVGRLRDTGVADRLWRLPNIPVSLGIVLGRSALEKPLLGAGQ